MTPIAEAEEDNGDDVKELDSFLSPQSVSGRNLGSVSMFSQPIVEVDDEMSDSDSSDISDHGVENSPPTI